jgi:hypothetical protein
MPPGEALTSHFPLPRGVDFGCQLILRLEPPRHPGMTRLPHSVVRFQSIPLAVFGPQLGDIPIVNSLELSTNIEGVTVKCENISYRLIDTRNADISVEDEDV